MQTKLTKSLKSRKGLSSTRFLTRLIEMFIIDWMSSTEASLNSDSMAAFCESVMLSPSMSESSEPPLAPLRSKSSSSWSKSFSSSSSRRLLLDFFDSFLSFLLCLCFLEVSFLCFLTGASSASSSSSLDDLMTSFFLFVFISTCPLDLDDVEVLVHEDGVDDDDEVSSIEGFCFVVVVVVASATSVSSSEESTINFLALI